MRRRLFLAALLLTACDRSSDFEACANEGQCTESVFKAEEPRWREVAGIVRRGDEGVAHALVRVEPSADFPASSAGAGAIPLTALTDNVGFFGGLRNVGFRYDIGAKLDRDIVFYRGVLGRYIEPSVESDEQPFSRAWRARVSASLEAPLPPGQSLAFFASGDGVFGVTGDLQSGLSLIVRDFTMPATLHTVAYETAGGLEKATAYAKTSLIANVAKPQLVTIRLGPLPAEVSPEFVVNAPSGFVPDGDVDVLIGFTRTSYARLATVPIGGTKSLPIIPDAGYTYRTRAKRGDELADSGETGFDVYKVTTVELPAPPIAVAPAEGETRGAGEFLTAEAADPSEIGSGVFEHVLQGPAATIRIITTQRDVALPDVRVFGVEPAGTYTWTIRNFTTMRFVENISGMDGRRYKPFSVSKSRTIILR